MNKAPVSDSISYAGYRFPPEVISYASNSHFDFLMGSEAGLRSRNFQTWSCPSQMSPIVWVRPGAGHCAERPVGLLGAAPTIPGLSWRLSGERSKRRDATTRSPALWLACDCLRSQVTARFVTRHSFACGALRGSGLKALDHELDDGRPAGKVEVGAQRADVGKELRG